jgi:hypothetical protein
LTLVDAERDSAEEPVGRERISTSFAGEYVNEEEERKEGVRARCWTNARGRRGVRSLSSCTAMWGDEEDRCTTASRCVAAWWCRWGKEDEPRELLSGVCCCVVEAERARTWWSRSTRESTTSSVCSAAVCSTLSAMPSIEVKLAANDTKPRPARRRNRKTGVVSLFVYVCTCVWVTDGQTETRQADRPTGTRKACGVSGKLNQAVQSTA